MPNARLAKLSKELNIPQVKLEEYWKKAKQIAMKKLPKKDPQYWSFVQGIFGNMLNVSESVPIESLSAKKKSARKTKLSANGLPLWWVKKSTNQKRAYLERNPGSKFAAIFKGEEAKADKKAKRAAAKNGGSVSPNVSLPEDTTPEEETEQPTQPEESAPESTPEPESTSPSETEPPDEWEDDEPEEPTEDPTPPNEPPTPPDDPTPPEDTKPPGFWKTTLKVINHAMKKQKHKVVMEMKKNKQGVKSLKNLLVGLPVSEADRDKAKHTAKVAGVLMLGALAGIAMFTPLGPLAATVGAHWYDSLMGKGSSESSDIDFDSPTNVEAGHWAFENESDDDNLVPEDEEEDDAHSDADYIVEQMTEWLAKQDIPKLVEQLKAQQEAEQNQPLTKDLGEGK